MQLGQRTTVHVGAGGGGLGAAGERDGRGVWRRRVTRSWGEEIEAASLLVVEAGDERCWVKNRVFIRSGS